MLTNMTKYYLRNYARRCIFGRVLSRGGFKMGKFFRFERMITPLIIQLVFWIGVIGSIIVGIITLISGLTGDGGFGGVFMGLLIMLIGPIGIRIYCEILMVAFKFLDLLVEIRDKLDRNGGSLSPTSSPTTDMSP